MKQLALTLLIPSLTLADVNTRDGDFSKTFSDFGMNRIYHSRSLSLGAFGFGWCSDWDTTLDIKTEKSGFLSDCQTNKSLPTSILKSGSFWIVQKAGSEWFFKQDGTLFKIKKTNGLEIQADRDAKTNFIHLLKTSQGERIQFQYENQNLKSKQSNQGIREKYEYDELHNLTEVSEWQKSQWQITDTMTYDTGRDLTLGHISSKGCADSFTYLQTTRLESSTVVQRQCAGRSIEVLKYQFTYQPNSDGTISLTRMAVISGSRTTQLSFHNRTGQLQPQLQERLGQTDGGLK